MNTTKFMRAAQMVGLKKALISGTTFVGRKREIRKIASAVTGLQVTPVWIWGARKMGKTSLSHRMPAGENIRTVRVSCDLHKWSGMEDLFRSFAEAGSEQLGIKIEESGKGWLSALGELGREKERFVLVLDEFDKIAVNLQQNEQASIRATLQKNPYFGIIFISRINPEELLQDYSEENSRLLGVCDINPLPMLKRDEVADLVGILEEACEEKIPDWVCPWVYERVGGYPVCVQSLLKEILILADEKGKFPAEMEMISEEGLLLNSVRSELRNLWKDLSFSIRKVVSEGNEKVAGNAQRELTALGLTGNSLSLRPRWLIEVNVGEREFLDVQRPPELMGLAEKLSESLKNCNDISLRKQRSKVFQTTEQIYRLFEIARPVEDEITLNERINLLYKICVESTDSDKKPKGDRCLIPEDIRPIYKKSEGFEILVGWRNFCFHDPSRDLEVCEISKRYSNIGEICCKYLGPDRVKPTTKDDINRIYKGILLDAVEAVDKLRTALEMN